MSVAEAVEWLDRHANSLSLGKAGCTVYQHYPMPLGRANVRRKRGESLAGMLVRAVESAQDIASGKPKRKRKAKTRAPLDRSLEIAMHRAASGRSVGAAN